MEIEVTYTPRLIGVGAEVGDDVDASCTAFEVQVHHALTASYPDADITVTRDQGLQDLSVVTHGFADRPLSVREAVWSDVWDLVSPYGRYRRPLRGGVVPVLPVVMARSSLRQRDTVTILIDGDGGDTLIDVDEDDGARAVMRSGFGVMA